MRLRGRVALVTGAGGGIGRAIARTMAAEGARVGINVHANRDGGAATLAAIREAGGDGRLLMGDITEPGTAGRLAGTLRDAFGPITVLVNNSGIGAPGSPNTAMTVALDDWDRVLAVNLRGALQMSRACLPDMLDRGGSIVNVASIRGVTAARGLAAYCASKGGLIALTQQMALEYARRGVRVNAVSPGFVESEMFAGYISRQPDPEAARAQFSGAAALGRTGRPDEIAEVVAFLASDEAAFVTGANLVADGGNLANGMREFL